MRSYGHGQVIVLRFWSQLQLLEEGPDGVPRSVVGAADAEHQRAGQWRMRPVPGKGARCRPYLSPVCASHCAEQFGTVRILDLYDPARDESEEGCHPLERAQTEFADVLLAWRFYSQSKPLSIMIQLCRIGPV